MMYLMFQTNDHTTRTASPSPLILGKYRIAALPRALPDGLFAAQVSIASGHGSASTDRVIRFDSAFATHHAAADYALAQGIDWVNDRDAARSSAFPN